MPGNTAKIIKLDSYRNRSSRGFGKKDVEESVFGRGLSDETMRTLSKRFSNPISELDYRNRAIFLLMSRSGLRAAEIVSLCFSNLLNSPKSETLVKYRKKGGKLAYSVLSEDTLKSIREYHSKFGISSDYFLLSRPKRHQSIRSPLSKRGLQLIVSSWNVKTLEGRNIFCHAIRHTAGRRMLEYAGSIATQKLLGHASANTSSKFYSPRFFDGNKFLTWD
ncbi:site-specific recombinase, phage integrase family [Leptospira broomii serovar Hurstbridge str. 5399]|uniref:Site-specific recombinase, phage integrase family n=1 Tax=Leptospira broomii serovar Hurstbridge str. 5399 TaxID=1049789 RepID=T0FAW0_9LEPT|nr:tyrosine-type recombinase/integrase [Leptospira broomii]EQA44692.1 site-specific recombinase, phage integrase family [Leptospira broomii serovar Hurstbridge str. 5399]